jgi:hypothetical protein
MAGQGLAMDMEKRRGLQGHRGKTAEQEKKRQCRTQVLRTMYVFPPRLRIQLLILE